MRIILTIVVLCLSNLIYAQTSFLKDAVLKLDRSLVQKDSTTLRQILHPELTYGHSNGWIETKKEVIADLFNGKLTYVKIESRDLKWKTGKDWASVRAVSEIKYKLDGKDGELKLHVLQVWLKTNRGWQLIARQSTKLN